MSLCRSVVTWLILVGVSVAAFAQDSDQPAEQIEVIPVEAETETPTPEAQVFEDIVVTATKRPASQRDVPASLAAFDGSELERKGVFEMQDYLRRIPGVQMTEILTDLSRISIRGIQLDSGGNTPEATGMFIDDIPLNDPFLNQARPDVSAFDLAGIELLKGPQGTLFGGSGLAGALRYKLADAQPGEWGFKSFVQYQDVAEGSSRRLGGAAANLPIGESAALRLTGVRRLAGGVIDDVRNGVADTDSNEHSSARAALRWDVGKQWSIRLKGFEQRTHSNDPPLAENTEGRLERERALRPSSPSDTKFEVYALNVNGAMPWADFVSLTSAVRKFAHYRNANAERTLGTEDSGQPADSPVVADIEGVVQEFRLASPETPAGAWRWLVGVFAHDYASFTTQRLFTRDALTGQETELLNFVADVEARELSVFGEVTRQLTDRWQATLGARGYKVETEGTVVSTGAIILATGSPENRNDAAIEVRGINPKAALQFQISDHASSYVSVARGFRFGGIQIVGPSPGSPDIPRTYRSDSLWCYELGVRTQWLDDTLRVDGGVFHIDWKDPQVNSISDGAVPLNVIENVDGARSQGGELSLRYLPPVHGLELELAAAHTDARTTEDFAGSGGANVPAGSRLPGYAEYQAVATVRYGRTLGWVAADADVSHVRQGPGVSDVLQSIRIHDYGTTDVRVAFRHAGRPDWPRFSMGVTNLTDERAVVSALVIDSTNYTTVYNRPRTYDARIDWAF